MRHCQRLTAFGMAGWLALVGGGVGAAPVQVEVGQSATVNLGEVWSGEEVTADVTLINSGDEDFQISSVSTSCGCTVAGSNVRVVAAHGSAEFPITFRAPSSQGRAYQRSTTVSLRSPGNNWTITLNSDIRSAISIEPMRLDFGTLGLSEDATTLVRSVEITNDTETPLRFDDISVTSGMFTASAETQELAAGESATVVVTLASPTRLGRFQGQLVIRTNSERMGIISVPLTGVVQGDVRIQPETVWLGSLPPDYEITRQVLVTCPGRADFEVVSAEVLHPGMTAVTAPAPQGGYRVAVTLEAGGADPGRLNATLVIRTNHPAQREIRVDVVGAVRAAP